MAAHRGFILWLTGMSGAGKSTLAEFFEREFRGKGYAVELLDGDEVRTHLSKGLSFSKEDRDINVRRIGFVARTLARHGVIVITAAISPYAEVRDEIRRLTEAEGNAAFVEVYAEAPLEALVERDVKGLYKKAIAGEIGHFTGVSDPYEAPQHPDVVAHTSLETLEVSAQRVLDYLREKHLIEADGGINSPLAATPDVLRT